MTIAVLRWLPETKRGGEAKGCPPRSAERDRVHQAALGPQPVEAALQLQRAALADIALEDLGVIADRLEGIERPGIVESEPGAELAAGAEQSLRRRVRLLRAGVGVGP